MSPSGKAPPSQGGIRGFESHHPLYLFNKPLSNPILLQRALHPLNPWLTKEYHLASFFKATPKLFYATILTNDEMNTTILHIEDNLDNRVLVRRLLSAEGYQVVEAVDAYEAVTALRQNSPALILMDINMPLVDGYTLTSKLKSLPRVKNIPIVALTANALRGDREKALRAGCNGYIEKPIDVDSFISQVEYFLEFKPWLKGTGLNGLYYRWD